MVLPTIPFCTSTSLIAAAAAHHLAGVKLGCVGNECHFRFYRKSDFGFLAVEGSYLEKELGKAFSLCPSAVQAKDKK
jgi:hypothetical protein